MELTEILYAVLALCAVILLLWEGIFIGREFGSFENFVLALLKKAERAMKRDK